jgi:restriction system protein
MNSDLNLKDVFAIPNPKDVVGKNFFGREAELKMLKALCQEEVRRWQSAPIIGITGPAGCGKTALAKRFVSHPPQDYAGVRWLNLENSHDPENQVKQLITGLRAGSKYYYVVIDGTDAISPEILRSATFESASKAGCLGFISLSRQPAWLRGIREIKLTYLPQHSVMNFAFELFQARLTPEQINQLIAATHSNLFALKVAASLLDTQTFSDVIRFIDGTLYTLETKSLSKQEQIIQVVRPQIIQINDTLIERLRRVPQGLYDITPRQFEEVVADLLAGMGMEVELTPATRDGGADIFAYIPTSLGKLLFLVEAKKYSMSNPVGVKLIRELHGSFVHHQANRAMLVTTSRFSRDSKLYQEQYKYHLSLAEYGDVVEWLNNHKA